MILIDSNILIDIISGNPLFCESSAQLLSKLEDRFDLAINAIIYGEISAGFTTEEQVETYIPANRYNRLELPWAAAFLAGQAFKRYRASGGAKISPIADFYIGAHAAVLGIPLATRDKARYVTYFPQVKLFTP